MQNYKKKSSEQLWGFNQRRKIKIALDKVIKKLIAETKATNSYIVVSDKNDKIKKLLTKDLWANRKAFNIFQPCQSFNLWKFFCGHIIQAT